VLVPGYPYTRYERRLGASGGEYVRLDALSIALDGEDEDLNMVLVVNGAELGKVGKRRNFPDCFSQSERLVEKLV
jgi:hypothetical protein